MSVRSMQASLERALYRARLSDDREVIGRIRTEGHRLAFLLNGLMRTTRLYAAENAALDTPARETAGALRTLVDLLGAAHLVCVEEHLYLNDVRLRVRPQEQGVVDAFIAELARHDVGGISFHAALPPEALKTVARALAGAAGEAPSARSALASRLRDLPDVQLSGRFRFRLTGEAPPASQGAWSDVLERGAAVAAGAASSVSANRIPNPLPVRRAVMDLVEYLREDASRATTPVRGGVRGFGYRHLVAVTNLALRIGQAAGLDDATLSDLGVAAMFHDVGYAKGGVRENHAVSGLRLLVRQRGFHEGKIRRLLTVLEHHDPWVESSPPSLFARIVKIADDYDILTAPRTGQKPVLPPPLAQGAMWAARKTVYDPDLLALFVQILGAYPPGSLLELSDGRRVVVVSGGRDRERFAWPVVRTADEDSTQLDLFLEQRSLRPKRVLNPATLGIDMAPILDRAFPPQTATG